MNNLATRCLKLFPRAFAAIRRFLTPLGTATPGSPYCRGLLRGAEEDDPLADDEEGVVADEELDRVADSSVGLTELGVTGTDLDGLRDSARSTATAGSDP